MKAIPIHEAKANLSKYIQQAKAGKPVLIGSRGQAEAMLTALPKAPKIKLGAWKHKLDIMIPDDFDDPDPEIIALFENSRIFPDGMV
jgi:antitoxin (DNA-binding transcriptional repressor) of toxin-antitoxin stability system